MFEMTRHKATASKQKTTATHRQANNTTSAQNPDFSISQFFSDFGVFNNRLILTKIPSRRARRSESKTKLHGEFDKKNKTLKKYKKS